MPVLLLKTVTDGSQTATYSYVANSPLVENVVFQQGSTVRMTSARIYDSLNRLKSIASAPSASAPVSFAYDYNSANQRTRATLADGSYWSYGYDALGQVTSGKKYFSDGTPAAGQQTSGTARPRRRGATARAAAW